MIDNNFTQKWQAYLHSRKERYEHLLFCQYLDARNSGLSQSYPSFKKVMNVVQDGVTHSIIFGTTYIAKEKTGNLKLIYPEKIDDD